MAEAGNSSRAMSDAPGDDVSYFVLGRGFFLQTAQRPTAARLYAREEVCSGSPPGLVEF